MSKKLEELSLPYFVQVRLLRILQGCLHAISVQLQPSYGATDDEVAKAVSLLHQRLVTKERDSLLDLLRITHLIGGATDKKACRIAYERWRSNENLAVYLSNQGNLPNKWRPSEFAELQTELWKALDGVFSEDESKDEQK